MNQYKKNLILLITVFMSACSLNSTLPIQELTTETWAIANSVKACQALLNSPVGAESDSIEPGRIGLLNWNIKKGSMQNWDTDLSDLAIGKELVILQEAVRNTEFKEQLVDFTYNSFSPGYSTKNATTGVATFSKRKPISECKLSVVEPWLRSRKATSITEYAITGREETLLVVNVHVVNFSIGLVQYKNQINQVRHVLSMHKGPVILSGDFNTWRQKRMDVVNKLIRDLEFFSVQTDNGHRKTFNGHPLDHVFVRGLSVASTETIKVTSSDHNPISVELLL